MGYLQALNLMVKAYKAARGVMPKGLDLLKLKMKARQKVIDSKKVVEFPKERITNPFKPRPRSESEAQMLARMNKQNKESAARLRNKKEVEKSLQKLKDSKKPQKTLKDLLDDYKGDPDAMADGGVASAIKKIKKRFGKKSITTGNKIKRPGNRQLLDDFKKRNKFNNGGPIDPSYLGIPPVGLGTGSRPGGHPYPSLDYYDDDAGVKGLMKKRKKKKKKREKKATGGLANISQTYDNNPTLQSQYPNKQDYLDLFSSTTTTTPQTQTYTQMTQQSPAGIPAVKPIVPIIPIPGGDGDGGGITNIDRGLKSADDYGFGPYGNNFNDPDVQKEIDELNPGGVKGFMQGIGNFYKTVSPFLNAKRALAKGQDFALDLIQKAKEAAAARELAKLQEAARAARFQGDTRTQSEQDFASSQTYGGGGTRGDMGADTFDI